MRKSTIFISAVLTTFALAILYGVVLAYQSTSSLPEATPLPVDTTISEQTVIPTPTITILTPEQAAQLAAQVVGNTNLLSAESSNLNGTDAYKITFTNNDVVYIGLDGQILGIQVAPMLVNVVAPAPVKHRERDNSNVNTGNTGEESHEDHEEHDD